MKTLATPSNIKKSILYILFFVISIPFIAHSSFSQSIEIIGDEDSVFTKKILEEKMPYEHIPTVDVGSQSYNALNSISVDKIDEKRNVLYFDVTDYEVTLNPIYTNDRGYLDVLYVFYLGEKGINNLDSDKIVKIEVIKEKENISNKLNSIESNNPNRIYNDDCDVLVIVSTKS